MGSAANSARDLILAPATGLTPLKGFDGAFVREIGIAEAESLGRMEKDAGYHLIVMTVVDAQGKPLFSEDDLDRLAQLPARTFRNISDQVTRASGLVDIEGAAEDAEKN